MAEKGYRVTIRASGTKEEVLGRLQKVVTDLERGDLLELKARDKGPRWFPGVDTAAIEVEEF